MALETQQLDAMQAKYKAAVDAWVSSIKHEEDLASQDHSVAEVDAWEAAGFQEETLRQKAKLAKKQYEDALRAEFYGFQGK